MAWNREKSPRTVPGSSRKDIDIAGEQFVFVLADHIREHGIYPLCSFPLPFLPSSFPFLRLAAIHIRWNGGIHVYPCCPSALMHNVQGLRCISRLVGRSDICVLAACYRASAVFSSLATSRGTVPAALRGSSIRGNSHPSTNLSKKSSTSPHPRRPFPSLLLRCNQGTFC